MDKNRLHSPIKMSKSSDQHRKKTACRLGTVKFLLNRRRNIKTGLCALPNLNLNSKNLFAWPDAPKVSRLGLLKAQAVSVMEIIHHGKNSRIQLLSQSISEWSLAPSTQEGPNLAKMKSSGWWPSIKLRTPWSQSPVSDKQSTDLLTCRNTPQLELLEFDLKSNKSWYDRSCLKEKCIYFT